ncbi:MAG: hypothetical protein KY475_15935, partial [Planctomycetes bacterium]|nr:hypothetical protein [Planctomycetota bacterium]
MYLSLNVLMTIDDQGGVMEVEVRKLPVKVLANLPGLFQLLPNDRYQIYLVRRDGDRLEVIEGQVREGKFYDPSGVEQTPHVELSPEAKQWLEEGQLPEESPDLPPAPGDGQDSAATSEGASAAGMTIASVAVWGRVAAARRRREKRRRAEVTPRVAASKAARIIRRLRGSR